MTAPLYKTPDAVVQAIRELPSPYEMPEILDEYLKNMNTQIDQINQLVRVDYSTIMRIFCIANSAVVGTEEKILKINDAITTLGHVEISRILNTNRDASYFPGFPRQLFSLTAFWNHCISTAIAAEVLAACINQKDTERYFLSGLLHDIGRLIMLITMPKQYAISMLEGRQKNRSLQSQELRIFGFDHTEVGVEAIRHWNLPHFLEEPIEFHHSPSDSHQQTSLTVITHLADALTHALHLGQSGEMMMPKIYSAQITELGIHPYQLTDLSYTIAQKATPLMIRSRMAQVPA